MPDLSAIEKNYKALSTFDLLKIARDPVGLHDEVIPILQRELIARGEPEEAEKVSKRLMDHAEEEALSMEHLTVEEIDAIVKERLAAGESIESIRLKLKDNGVKLYDDLERESQFQEQALDFIASRRENAHNNDDQIGKEVQEIFSMNEDEVAALKAKLKSRAKGYLILGYPLLIISIGLYLLIMASKENVPKGLYLLIFSSGWLVFRGHKILNNL